MISKKAENLIKMCEDEYLSSYIPKFIVLDNQFFLNCAKFNLQESVKKYLNEAEENPEGAGEIAKEYRKEVEKISVDISQFALTENTPYCVRSSFFEDIDHQSFTGRFATVLDVSKHMTEAAVKQVIQSYYSSEMIEMYDTIDINEEFEPTVIIQEMKGQVNLSSEIPMLSELVLDKIRKISEVIEERVIHGPSDLELVIEEGQKSYSGVLFTVDPRNGDQYLSLRLTSGVGTAVGKAEQEQIYYISRDSDHKWAFCKENTKNLIENPELWVVQSRTLKVSKWEENKNKIDTSNYKSLKGEIISSSDTIFEKFLICADLETAWSVWLNAEEKDFSIAVQTGNLLEHEAILLREKNVFVCRIYISKLVELQYVKAFFDTSRSRFYFLDEKQKIKMDGVEVEKEEDFDVQIKKLIDVMEAFHREDVFAYDINRCDNFLSDSRKFKNIGCLIQSIFPSIVNEIAASVLAYRLYSKECEEIFKQFQTEKAIQEVLTEWIMSQESKQWMADALEADKELIHIAVESLVKEEEAVWIYRTYLSAKDLDLNEKRIIFRRMLKYKDDAFFAPGCDWKRICQRVKSLEIDLNLFFDLTEKMFGPWFFDYFLGLNQQESKCITNNIFKNEFVGTVIKELCKYYISNEMLLLKELLIQNRKSIYEWFQEFYDSFHDTVLMNSIVSILSESYDLVCKVCLTNMQEYREEYSVLLSAWIDLLAYLNNCAKFDSIARKAIITAQEFISMEEIYKDDIDIDDFWINVVENQEIGNLHVLHNIVHQTSLYLLENYYILHVTQKEYVEIHHSINSILGQRSQFINSIMGHTELQLSLSQHKSSITYLPNQIILRYMSAQGTEEICTDNRNKAIIYWLTYIQSEDIQIQYQTIKSGSSTGLYVHIQGNNMDYEQVKEKTIEIITILSALAGFSLFVYPYENKSKFQEQRFLLEKLIDYTRTKYNTEYKIGYKLSPQSFLLTEAGIYPELYNWIGQELSGNFEHFTNMVKKNMLHTRMCDQWTGQQHPWWLMSLAGLVISIFYPEDALQAISKHQLDQELSSDAICKNLFMNLKIVKKAYQMYQQGNQEITHYLVRYAPVYLIQLWRNKEADLIKLLEINEQVSGNLLLCFAALEMETLCKDLKFTYYYNQYVDYCEERYKDRYRLHDSDLGAVYISRVSYEYLMKSDNLAERKLKCVLKKNLVIDCNQFDYTFLF